MSDNTNTVLWPGWETVGLIGRGSFGSVYKIQRDVLGDIEEAALKVISIPQNASDIDDLYNDGYDDESITNAFNNHLKSIVAEYSLMRKMTGSSHVVNCDDVRYVQHDDGIGWDIYIKMELLMPLPKVLPAAYSEGTAIKIARDMCSALELCKKYDIIHRDIKPQNIFVSPNGDYKLGDFGIAKTVEKTMGGTKIGTYKYMAPEVYNNQPYGTTSDICSLGLVLYWILNERRMPFMPLPPEKIRAGMDQEAWTRRFSGEDFPPPVNGSPQLKAIVMKACAFRPEDRFASAEEMLHALNALGKQIPYDGPIPGDDLPPDDDPVPGDDLPPDDDPVPGDDLPPDDDPKPPRKLPVLAAVPVLLLVLLLAVFAGNGFRFPGTNASGAQWSGWVDELPEGITADRYIIAEQILYRSRQLSLISSTTDTEMDGWELYDKQENTYFFRKWSDWSEFSTIPIAVQEGIEVEIKTQYRYQEKD